MGPALCPKPGFPRNSLVFSVSSAFCCQTFHFSASPPFFDHVQLLLQIWESCNSAEKLLDERKCVTYHSHILGSQKKREKEKGRKERKKERSSRHLSGIFSLTLDRMEFHQFSDALIPTFSSSGKHSGTFLHQAGAGIVFGTFLLRDSVVLPGIRQKQSLRCQFL